jgi:hypothetical protein
MRLVESVLGTVVERILFADLAGSDDVGAGKSGMGGA